MKITYSKEKINSFGGINFADLIIQNTSAYDVIDHILGKRGFLASYSYSDLIRSYVFLVLCGDDCSEDITENLRAGLQQVKGFEACSADTLLRMQKELASEKEKFVTATGI